MNIEWRTGIGYGDFVTGLGYAHTSRLKYERPIDITFHWKDDKNHLYSPLDTETLFDRFQYIESIFKQTDGITIHHKFNSNPKFRFYNQLDEFNPLHGLWYTNLEPQETKKKVVLWTTDFNIEFPGINKDPAHKHWLDIRAKLHMSGYDIYEVTYRTPIKQVIRHINECEFGIGYDGLAHQLFKFMWKPLIVFCKRKPLNSVLIPQAVLEDNPKRFLDSNIKNYVRASQKRVEEVKQLHQNYISEKKDATKHELYNSFIY
jgi:hypothetical protein